VRTQEARIRARVTLSEHHGRSDLAGQTGTIERIYGAPPKKTALHVRFDDGCWQLLWHHEVEPSGEG
jgi:hypothetical protein